ncbi:hypothetical protein [Methylotenera sp. G11]|uniref:hypothetical protein n=1 Tax=Methylotenera sp. G11 TaxID=1506585 RepID=UPI000646D3F7|nr:hypothetical protein [Methylotenera sp. G11]
MLMALRKRLLWIVVIWFALLQTVLPFIHAHLEADSPAQGQGLHVHAQGLAQVPGAEHAFNTISSPPVHTIGVNEAVEKNIDPLPLPLFTLLFVISLAAITISLAGIKPARHPLPLLYLRSLSRPRAPPLF